MRVERLAGFAGHGLMHAPGCGRAMAELLLTGGYETNDCNEDSAID